MSQSRRAWLLAQVSAFVVGCSCNKATQQMYSPEELKERFRTEAAGEYKMLVELEKKFGMNHSQVRQMKMELGLDPEKPASEQSL